MPAKQTNNSQILKLVIFFLISLIIVQYFFPKAKGLEKKEDVIQTTEVLKTSPISLETPKLNLVFDSENMRLNSAIFKDLFKTVKKKEPIQLLNEDLVLEWGFLHQSPEMRAVAGHWKKISQNGNEIIFQQKAKTLIYKIKVYPKNDFLFVVEQNVLNVGRTDESVSVYGRFIQKGEAKSNSYIHKGWLGYLNNSLEEKSVSAVRDETLEFSGTQGWFGWTNQYTEAVLRTDLPTQDVRFSGKETQSQADFNSGNIILHAGESKHVISQVYLGPKDEVLLKKYEDEGFDKLSYSVDYGWFYFIAKPFAQALRWLNKWFGNMGWAILMLTLIIRIVLYPLSRKSLHAMAKMKDLQPKIKAIQAKFAHDKTRMQQEIMKIYKNNKVSPASGCVPMLLQIPVFFAFYRLLTVSIDLRQASFFYIPDLSLADPTSLFNLFGLLPFTVPTWLPALGLLPVVMGISMWAQQKVQGTTSTTPQSKIMGYLPFIFVLMFGGLPAGLVLYWMASNLFSLLQTVLIKRSMT
ncbi:MAG: membrane protein insertase YidC [Alphaproteobacteria bacterium]|nr:membrane protein insertase YidC [Alphaproteobacteria bacterium]